MLAAVYEDTGDSDVLKVREVDRPEPGPGEVLVRVRVSGVNPTDWKSRSGSSGGRAEGVPFQVPNQDGAGEIEAVGDGVDPARVGERVWLYFAAWQRQWGTAAQYTVIPAERAVPLGRASFDLGASLGIPAMTAHRCLYADGDIDGATVLVAGGAGAVGRAAIELAKFGEARVVATVSSEEKGQVALDAGADAVVNYRDDGAAEQVRAAAPDGVDRVVELDLARNLELDLAVCARHASIVSYAGESGDAEIPIRGWMLLNANLRFVFIYTEPADAVDTAAHGVAEAVAAGALTEPAFHRFPLEDAAAAHDAVQDGAVGKVLIDVP